MEKVLFLLALLYLYATPSFAEFWIDDGDNIVSSHSDPDKCCENIEYWAVRLYKKGESIPNGKTWGLLTGYTASEVMDKLKKQQAECEKFFTACHEDTLTFFNSLGPIAIVRKTKKNKLQDKAIALLKHANEIMKEYSIHSGVSGVSTKEYLENLTKIIKLQDQLERIYESTTAPLSKIQAALNEVDRELKKAESHNTKTSIKGPNYINQNNNKSNKAADKKSAGLKFLMRVDKPQSGDPFSYYLVIKPDSEETYDMEGRLEHITRNNDILEGSDGRQYRILLSWKGSVFENRLVRVDHNASADDAPECTYYELEGDKLTHWLYSKGGLCEPARSNSGFLTKGDIDITKRKSVYAVGHLVKNHK